ncbi:MAG TPA: AAA family ATPase [Gemmatimonadales bacterium]|nr:AAA family ATPase [Gemmatimonadales bacterium]
MLRAGSPEPVIGPGKPVALLAYLACAPRRTALRDHLIDLLWADLDPERARHALRQTIWYLKRQTGRAVVESENGHLLLATDIACDRDAFLDAIESREMARAVDLYAGPFVPDFAAPGGAEFEKWADMERYRLQTLFQQAIEETARAHLAHGHHRDAIALARRARGLAPGHEASWRLLFESLLSAGDTVGAAIEREAFQRLLADEELSPEPATLALLGRLDGDAPIADAPTPPSRLVTELVGRELEFGQVVQGWDRARLGPALHFHVSGHPGIGKSRLLGDIHRRLRASGARVVQVRAAPASRTLTFGLAGDLAAALASLPGAKGIPEASASTLVGLNPALAASFRAPSDNSSGDEALRRRILAVVDLLNAVTDEAPVALLIDDLHWSDPQSRALLEGVLDRLDGMRALVVTAARATGEGTTHRPDARLVTLAPLDPSAIGALLTSLADLPVAPWADDLAAALHRSTGGTPLDLLETLQLALDAEALAIRDGGWALLDPPGLERLLREGSALEHRIRRLERSDHWTLLVATASGGALSEASLVAIGAGSGLALLEQRGLLLRTEAGLLPAHDEVARWTWEIATPEARAAARRLLAQHLLDNAPNDRARLAQALRLADPATDPALVQRIVARAVDQARREGDRRAGREIIRELTGEEHAAALLDPLVGGPAGWARTAAFRWWTAAAAASMLLLAGAYAFLPTRGAGAPLLMRWYYSPRQDRAILGALPLGPADAQGGVLMPGSFADSVTVPAPPGTVLAGLPRLREDGTAALQVEYRDSGGIDIVTRTADGRYTRLSNDPQDDNVAGWSPDGRWIIGTSGRNSPRGSTDYDIIAIDPATRETRTLVRGRDHDQGPMISPDGTKLAFIRMSLDTIGPRRFCVTWFDGSEAKCIALPDGDAEGILGWIDRTQVAVLSRDARGLTTGILDLPAMTLRTLRRVYADDAALSPDGGWLLCHCREEDAGTQQLFAVAAPSRLIELRWADRGSAAAGLIWAQGRLRREWLERVEATGPARVPLGAAGRFTATGVTAEGAPFADLSPRWSVRDTTVATIEPRTGVARGIRAGTTWVIVTAGGWRSDSLRVSVTAAGGAVVARETWTPGWEERWVPWGDPKPYLKGIDGAAALHLAGDGSNHSGISRWPGWQGPSFGAEIELRARFDRVNWQTVNLTIDRGLDSISFARWDKTSGSLPSGFRESCAVGYGGESLFWRGHLAVRATDEVVAPSAPADLAQGKRWFRLRVQVFADGRCGVALDGMPLWQSTAPLAGRFPPVVSVHGMSYRTDILIRRIETWAGVRGDIDWTKAPTTVELGD